MEEIFQRHKQNLYVQVPLAFSSNGLCQKRFVPLTIFSYFLNKDGTNKRFFHFRGIL